MAGIAAYFGNDQTALADLSNGLASRGPDTATWTEGRLGLAIRAALPVMHYAGELAAVVEGVAETSRLLNDYTALGPEALVRAGEPYAIAVADPERDALLLARAGDGPEIYYAAVGGTVMAAAEPGALIAAGIPATPDTAVVKRFVDTGICDENEATFFAGIRRVLPGQVVEVTPGGIDMCFVPAGEVQPAPSLPLAIQEAVRHGHRVGVRLAENPDDGVVLAAVLAHPWAHRPVPAYQPMFGDGPEGEAPDGHKQGSVVRVTVPVTAEQLTADLPAFLVDLGEPAPDLASYLLWSSARVSMGDVDTLLDPTTGLPGGYLSRVADRISARFGVGVRFPMITAEVSEQARSADRLRLADLLRQIKDRVYGSFLTEDFAARPWVDSSAALARFDAFVTGRGRHDPAWFWRLYVVEQWLRKSPADAPPVEHELFAAHHDKQLDIVADGRSWLRFPVRTHLFVPGDAVPKKIAGYVSELVAEARAHPLYRDVFRKPWYLVTAEKVVAVSQGRSYLLWEIKPGLCARTLARLASAKSYGVGRRSAWIMELAIREAGRWRMLLATLAGLLGPRSWFDNVAGQRAAAIDGPADHSLYPANLSATLGAADPDQVAAEILEALRRALPEDAAGQLRGCAVMDARDSVRRVSGSHADKSDEFFEQAFADNPLGQGGERTPVAVVVSASAVRRPKRSKPRPRRTKAAAKAR